MNINTFDALRWKGYILGTNKTAALEEGHSLEKGFVLLMRGEEKYVDV